MKNIIIVIKEISKGINKETILNEPNYENLTENLIDFLGARALNQKGQQSI